MMMKVKQNAEKGNIGVNIRKFRKMNGLTQEQTAARLQLRGIRTSRGSYSHIECGLGNIRVEELIGLAEIFHTGIADFFEGITLS
ncbi:MAG: helix-turn-helix domain-containing protein [Acetatifactor sp.]|nr:helix-turn-helix domain-containing protein [Acetatifactor sp.]MDE7043946.1 helix-turn-helix domain-containing protein [Acetatifactor sp.]